MERIKVLMASAPFDGHFNPLTPLALALIEAGYDVRWYTHERYAPSLAKLHIPHFPFKGVLQFHDGNMDDIFPRRSTIKGQTARINFDIQEIFIKRGPEYYNDLKNIYKVFPFDVMVADLGFTGIAYVNRLMRIPVIGVSVFPLMESSKYLPPYGFGLPPSRTLPGKLKMAALRLFAKHVVFRKSNALNNAISAANGIRSTGHLFDDAIYHSTIVLQSGSPGFEYARKDKSDHIRFCGPLIPVSRNGSGFVIYNDLRYDNTLLVTQGTVEKDVEKIIVPTLQAYRGTNTRVIVTTGGSGTQELRKRFPDDNFIIEDFIPFAEVMPYCDVFISNGGYGGVLQSIQQELPMVVAGIHEGKNEICARVGYFKLGINLATEKPSPAMIRAAVDQVITDPSYRVNVRKLAAEFSEYDPRFLVKKFVYMLTNQVRIAMPDGKKDIRISQLDLSNNLSH